VQSLDIAGLSATFVYVVVFAVAAGETSAFLGLIVPGETVIIAAGALARPEKLSVPLLIGVVVAGAIIGDSIGWLLGHRYGFRWADRISRRRRSWNRRLRRVRGWMGGRRGGLAVVIGRFVGYVRPLMPFTAGGAGMPYGTFLAFDVPATIAWASGSVLLGVAFGASGERILQTFGIGATAVAVLVVVIAVAVIITRRRRRVASLSSASAGDDLHREADRRAA
jgi:membrane-associated protein